MHIDKQLSYELVQTPEQYARVCSFCESFSQSPYKPENGAILIVKRDEQWIGVAQVVNSPIVITAWKPSETSTRDAKEGLEGLTSWAKVQAGLQGKTLAGFALTDYNSKFTPEIMNKLGFNKIESFLYAPRT